MSKQEYIIFHILLVCVAIHAYQGGKLFHNGDSKFGSRKNKGIRLLTRINFGKLMKYWRFKYINTYLPRIMEAEELKDIDDW